MNEWMVNYTPAQNTNRSLGVRQMVIQNQILYIKIKNSQGYKIHCKELCTIKISQLVLFKIYSKIQFF